MDGLIIMEFKPGQKFKAIVPFGAPKSFKVHIDHVIPSYYSDVTLIIYRVYGKHKQWWHEFMCTAEDMQYYIDKNSRVNVKL